MLKSVLYRKDNGQAITFKDVGWEWSDVEKGLLPTPKGFYFATADIEVTDSQIAGSDPDEPHDPCIDCGELKVNDVNNPTTLVEI